MKVIASVLQAVGRTLGVAGELLDDDPKKPDPQSVILQDYTAAVKGSTSQLGKANEIMAAHSRRVLKVVREATGDPSVSIFVGLERLITQRDEARKSLFRLGLGADSYAPDRERIMHNARPFAGPGDHEPDGGYPLPDHTPPAPPLYLRDYDSSLPEADRPVRCAHCFCWVAPTCVNEHTCTAIAQGAARAFESEPRIPTSSPGVVGVMVGKGKARFVGVEQTTEELAAVAPPQPQITPVVEAVVHQVLARLEALEGEFAFARSVGTKVDELAHDTGNAQLGYTKELMAQGKLLADLRGRHELLAQGTEKLAKHVAAELGALHALVKPKPAPLSTDDLAFVAEVERATHPFVNPPEASAQPAGAMSQAEAMAATTSRLQARVDAANPDLVPTSEKRTPSDAWILPSKRLTDGEPKG